MEIAASLRGVTRTFKDVTALRGLDLTLRGGKIYGLLGPNGSGKTTTLRTLLGLSLPDKGEVALLGGPPNDSRRSRVGFVPETRGLPDSARVRRVLVFFARMRGFDRREARRRAEEWIDKLELGEKANARVKTLSNGQQQKVQIALALMCEPDVIFLDEPLTGLDPTHQELVSKHVRQAADDGACVVLSTHRLREAEDFVDHVVMLSRGVKVLDASLDRALQQGFDGTWRVRAGDRMGWVEGPEVLEVTRRGRDLRVRLREGAKIGPLLSRAAQAGAPVEVVEAMMPSLHELYLARVRRVDP